MRLRIHLIILIDCIERLFHCISIVTIVAYRLSGQDALDRIKYECNKMPTKISDFIPRDVSR